MTKKTKTTTQRKRYSHQFKKEALLRAAKDGVPMGCTRSGPAANPVVRLA